MKNCSMIKKKLSAILLIGGSGKRFGTASPKQYQLLVDKPVWIWAAQTLYATDGIDELIVVCDLAFRDTVLSDVEKYGLAERTHLTGGGATRQDSVLNGCLAATGDIVIIHDGARPFVPMSIATAIRLISDSTDENYCVAMGLPVTDTLRNAKTYDTINRDELWKMQTPQLMYRSQLIKALQYCKENTIIVTDDVAAMHAIGCRLDFVVGSRDNLKMTTQDDLPFAEFIAKRLFDEQ